jgi:hypothetical protein
VQEEVPEGPEAEEVHQAREAASGLTQVDLDTARAPADPSRGLAPVDREFLRLLGFHCDW